MKTFSVYVMYNDGTTQEAHKLHTVKYVGHTTGIVSIEDAIKEQADLRNIVGVYGDDEFLIIRDNFRSIRFWNK